MAGQMFALGPVKVATPGTPVQLPSLPPPQPSSVNALSLVALPTNTGKIYIGVSGMNKGTLVGVIDVLPPASASAIPSFSLSGSAMAANGVLITQFYIDADNATEGVLVSALVA